MRCPHCNSENCTIVNAVTTTGKDYSASKGCCGAILLGPLGLLCGACGEGRKIHNVNYWVCGDCGYKFRM